MDMNGVSVNEKFRFYRGGRRNHGEKEGRWMLNRDKEQNATTRAGQCTFVSKTSGDLLMDHVCAAAAARHKCRLIISDYTKHECLKKHGDLY